MDGVEGESERTADGLASRVDARVVRVALVDSHVTGAVACALEDVSVIARRRAAAGIEFGPAHVENKWTADARSGVRRLLLRAHIAGLFAVVRGFVKDEHAVGVDDVHRKSCGIARALEGQGEAARGWVRRGVGCGEGRALNGRIAAQSAVDIAARGVF